MSKKSRNRFNMPSYGQFGLSMEGLKHIYDYIDGSGPVNTSIREALLNDMLAGSAWQRSEFSADAASQRQIDATRELRSTQFQDIVGSAQAAGINPIFALGGGISSPASAPQASAPAGSASGGTPLANLDSMLNVIQTHLMARKNRAEVAQLKAETNVANAQAKNIAANTVKTSSETKGQDLANEWAQRTMNARVASPELANNLTRAQESEIYKGIEKASHEINTLDAQALQYGARAMLDNMTQYRMARLIPFEQAVMSAQTEKDRAIASGALVHALYENRVIDSGIIESNARLAGLQGDAQEIMNEVSEYNKAIQQGDPDRVVTKDKLSHFILSTAAAFGNLRQATGINLGYNGSFSQSYSQVNSIKNQ